MPEHYPFQNPPLPYPYDALEPYIDGETMYYHHDKHLQKYTDELNKALRGQPWLQEMSLEQLIQVAPRLPSEVGTPVGRNAGGVYNHRLFFQALSPMTGMKVGATLAAAIARDFGSVPRFQEQFIAAALSVFGSGYAWLIADPSCKLHIVTTANQETPIMWGEHPILNLDVWEHAYYLKYKNERETYSENWWNVVNWMVADERYQVCLAQRGR